MKNVLAAIAVFFAVTGICAAQGGREALEGSPQLKALVKKYPEADADGDGVLTSGEALAYFRKAKGGKPASDGVKPTHANVSYAPSPACVMNLWLAESDAPTPMIVNIHGGGFVAGDKKGSIDKAMFDKLGQEKVSYASIQYRFQSKDFPLSNVLRDIARSVQFLRCHAKEYNLDPDRIGLTGSSAGGNAAAWLGFRDDLADPASADPVLRESTRVQAVWANVPSVTMDFWQWPDYLDFITPKTYTNQLVKWGYDPAIDPNTPEMKKLRADVDTKEFASPDDPPICILNNNAPDSLLHNPKSAQALHEVALKAGIRAELYMKEIVGNYDQRPNETDWLIARLREAKGQGSAQNPAPPALVSP